MEDNRDLKVMLIGNSSVGKTSLILKYKSKKFSSNLSSTVGVDMTVDKNVTINGQTYDIAIWDTAGQEKYRSIQQWLNPKKSDVAMLCFDLSDPLSLDTIASWIEFLRSNAPERMKIIIIGTKKDLPSKYTSEQLHQVKMAWLANFNEEFPILMTSSVTGEGLEEAFQMAYKIAAISKYEQGNTISALSKKASFKISTTSHCRSQNNFQKTEQIISHTNSEIKPQPKPAESGCC